MPSSVNPSPHTARPASETSAKAATPVAIPQVGEAPSSGWTRAALKELVQSAWAEALGRPAEGLSGDTRFKDVGGTSLKAAHIHTLLEDAYRRFCRLYRLSSIPVLQDGRSFLS